MELKIGDRVFSERYGLGKIVTIMGGDPFPYGVEFCSFDANLHNLDEKCKDGYGLWCTTNKELDDEWYIIPYEFSKEDLKIGDKLTTRSGAEFIYINDFHIIEINDFYTSELVSINDLNGKLAIKDNLYFNEEVVKVERPTYKTIFERKEEILDEKEKEYLAGVIRPFRDRVKFIEKCWGYSESQSIYVYLENETITFPYFEKGTMYKNMEESKKYTLKELGLDE